MAITEINTDIGRNVIGHTVNAELSQENIKKLATAKKNLSQQFGASIWSAPLKHSISR